MFVILIKANDQYMSFGSTFLLKGLNFHFTFYHNDNEYERKEDKNCSAGLKLLKRTENLKPQHIQ